MEGFLITSTFLSFAKEDDDEEEEKEEEDSDGWLVKVAQVNPVKPWVVADNDEDDDEEEEEDSDGWLVKVAQVKPCVYGIFKVRGLRFGPSLVKKSSNIFAKHTPLSANASMAISLLTLGDALSQSSRIFIIIDGKINT